MEYERNIHCPQNHPDMLAFQPDITAKWQDLLTTLKTIPYKKAQDCLRPEEYAVNGQSLPGIL